MKKLLLVQPVSRLSLKSGLDMNLTQVPPLALAYIAALTPGDWEIKIVDEYMEKIDFETHWDIVGITALTSIAPRAYEISEEFRKRGVTTVIGGIHVYSCSDEALNYCDAVVIGEAETEWPKLIEDYEKGRLKRVYKGDRPDLKNLPIPRRDLLSDKYPYDVIQTSRGCHLNCEFCIVRCIYGIQRYRPIDEVLNEFETLKKREVFVTDDNFFVSRHKEGKERAIALCKGLIERKIKKMWMTHGSLDAADAPELLEHARKAGCKIIYVGIESLIPENLKLMNKAVNYKLQLEGIKKAIKIFHKHGIAVWAAIIFGYDYDNVSVFQRTLDFVREVGLDIAHFGIFTPYPGTRYRERLLKENKILFHNYPDDWDLYDSEHMVIKLKDLNSEEMIRGLDYLSRKIYSTGPRMLSTFKTLVNTRSLILPFAVYFMNKI